MSGVLTMPTPRVFAPLLADARYKAAHGGRGSGKSHFFAEMLIEECLATKGTLAVSIREVQKSLKESSKRLLEMKIQSMNRGPDFRVFADRIQTPGDGIILFQGMRDHTAETIKSLEGFRIADIEEGQALSETSFTLLRPTIRTPGSQIWARWNPRRKTDPVDHLFRGVDEQTGLPLPKPPRSIIVKANWRDNPFWNEELELERQTDLRKYPDRYPHVWEGSYATAFDGAYYAKSLNEARAQNRIGKVSVDPLARIRAYQDIGGAGAKADAQAIWIVQFVGQNILVHDYLEGVGQTMGYYVNLMRSRGWGEDKNTLVVLPHDGMNANNILGDRYMDHWEKAGFDVETVPNQGPGAAMQRIEAGRNIFPRCYINEEKCRAGLEALGWYHEKKHPQHGHGMGPDHDWACHGADAFGLMAVHWEPPATRIKPKEHSPSQMLGRVSSGGWMGQ